MGADVVLSSSGAPSQPQRAPQGLARAIGAHQGSLRSVREFGAYFRKRGGVHGIIIREEQGGPAESEHSGRVPESKATSARSPEAPSLGKPIASERSTMCERRTFDKIQAGRFGAMWGTLNPGKDAKNPYKET